MQAEAPDFFKKKFARRTIIGRKRCVHFIDSKMQNRNTDPLSVLAYEFMFDKKGLPARLDEITAADAAAGQVRWRKTYR